MALTRTTALTKAQIAVLRHASECSVWEQGQVGIKLHPFVPYQGAPGLKVVRHLQKRGLLDEKGLITVRGKGKLLIDPVASSERT